MKPRIWGRFKPRRDNVPTNWKKWVDRFLPFNIHGDKAVLCPQWMSQQKAAGKELPPFIFLNREDVEKI